MTTSQNKYPKKTKKHEYILSDFSDKQRIKHLAQVYEGLKTSSTFFNQSVDSIVENLINIEPAIEGMKAVDLWNKLYTDEIKEKVDAKRFLCSTIGLPILLLILRHIKVRFEVAEEKSNTAYCFYPKGSNTKIFLFFDLTHSHSKVTYTMQRSARARYAELGISEMVLLPLLPFIYFLKPKTMVRIRDENFSIPRFTTKSYYEASKESEAVYQDRHRHIEDACRVPMTARYSEVKIGDIELCKNLPSNFLQGTELTGRQTPDIFIIKSRNMLKVPTNLIIGDFACTINPRQSADDKIAKYHSICNAIHKNTKSVVLLVAIVAHADLHLKPNMHDGYIVKYKYYCDSELNYDLHDIEFFRSLKPTIMKAVEKSKDFTTDIRRLLMFGIETPISHAESMVPSAIITRGEFHEDTLILPAVESMTHARISQPIINLGESEMREFDTTVPTEIYNTNPKLADEIADYLHERIVYDESRFFLSTFEERNQDASEYLEELQSGKQLVSYRNDITVDHYERNLFKGMKGPERFVILPVSDLEESGPVGNNRRAVIEFANKIMPDVGSFIIMNDEPVLWTLKAALIQITEENLIPLTPSLQSLFKVEVHDINVQNCKPHVYVKPGNKQMEEAVNWFANSPMSQLPDYLMTVIPDGESALAIQQNVVRAYKARDCLNARVARHTSTMDKLMKHIMRPISTKMWKGKKTIFVSSAFSSNMTFLIYPGKKVSGSSSKVRIASFFFCSSDYYRIIVKPCFHIHEAISYPNDTVLVLTKPYAISKSEMDHLNSIETQCLSVTCAMFDKLKKEDDPYYNWLQGFQFLCSSMKQVDLPKFMDYIRYGIPQSLGYEFSLRQSIIDRFPKRLSSFLSSYVVPRALDCLVRGPDIFNYNIDTEMDGTSRTRFTALAPYSGKTVSDKDMLLLEMYIFKTANDEHTEPLHKVKKTLKSIKEAEDAKVHVYDLNYISMVGNLVHEFIGPDFYDQQLIKLDRNKIIGHLKNSSCVADPDLHIVFGKLLSDNIMVYLSREGYGKTIGRFIENMKVDRVIINVGVKSEIKGDREINSTTMSILMVLKAIEAITQEVNKKLGFEGISKTGKEKDIHFQGQNSLYISLVKNNRDMYGIRSNHDAKKWSTGDNVRTLFTTFCSVLIGLNHDQILRKWDSLYKIKMQTDWTISDKILWVIANMADRDLSSRGEIGSRAVEETFGSKKVTLTEGWPQGFFNSLSSLKHCLAYLGAAMYKKKYHPTAFLQFGCHSDDGHNDILARKIRDAFLICLAIELSKLFAQIFGNSTKKAEAPPIKDIKEYLALLGIGEVTVHPSMKFAFKILGDLPGASLTGDLKALASCMLKGVENGLGSLWYHPMMLYCDSFVRKSHGFLPGMRFDLDLDDPYLIPEELGGRYYAPIQLVGMCPSKANHLRILSVPRGYEKLLTLYSSKLFLSKGCSLNIFPKDSRKNNTALNILLNGIVFARELLAIPQEQRPKFNDLMLFADDETRFKANFYNLISQSSARSYSSSKVNYSVSLAKTTYSECRLDGKTFGSFTEAIKYALSESVQLPMNECVQLICGYDQNVYNYYQNVYDSIDYDGLQRIREDSMKSAVYKYELKFQVTDDISFSPKELRKEEEYANIMAQLSEAYFEGRIHVPPDEIVRRVITMSNHDGYINLKYPPQGMSDTEKILSMFAVSVVYPDDKCIVDIYKPEQEEEETERFPAIEGFVNKKDKVADMTPKKAAQILAQCITLKAVNTYINHINDEKSLPMIDLESLNRIVYINEDGIEQGLLAYYIENRKGCAPATIMTSVNQALFFISDCKYTLPVTKFKIFTIDNFLFAQIYECAEYSILINIFDKTIMIAWETERDYNVANKGLDIKLNTKTADKLAFVIEWLNVNKDMITMEVLKYTLAQFQILSQLKVPSTDNAGRRMKLANYKRDDKVTSGIVYSGGLLCIRMKQEAFGGKLLPYRVMNDVRSHYEFVPNEYLETEGHRVLTNQRLEFVEGVPVVVAEFKGNPIALCALNLSSAPLNIPSCIIIPDDMSDDPIRLTRENIANGMHYIFSSPRSSSLFALPIFGPQARTYYMKSKKAFPTRCKISNIDEAIFKPKEKYNPFMVPTLHPIIKSTDPSSFGQSIVYSATYNLQSAPVQKMVLKNTVLDTIDSDDEDLYASAGLRRFQSSQIVEQSEASTRESIAVEQVKQPIIGNQPIISEGEGNRICIADKPLLKEDEEKGASEDDFEVTAARKKKKVVKNPVDKIIQEVEENKAVIASDRAIILEEELEETFGVLAKPLDTGEIPIIIPVAERHEEHYQEKSGIEIRQPYNDQEFDDLFDDGIDAEIIVHEYETKEFLYMPGVRQACKTFKRKYEPILYSSYYTIICYSAIRTMPSMPYDFLAHLESRREVIVDSYKNSTDDQVIGCAQALLILMTEANIPPSSDKTEQDFVLKKAISLIEVVAVQSLIRSILFPNLDRL